MLTMNVECFLPFVIILFVVFYRSHCMWKTIGNFCQTIDGYNLSIYCLSIKVGHIRNAVFFFLNCYTKNMYKKISYAFRLTTNTKFRFPKQCTHKCKVSKIPLPIKYWIERFNPSQLISSSHSLLHHFIYIAHFTNDTLKHWNIETDHIWSPSSSFNFKLSARYN